jgi:hypothetical protein
MKKLVVLAALLMSSAARAQPAWETAHAWDICRSVAIDEGNAYRRSERAEKVYFTHWDCLDNLGFWPLNSNGCRPPVGSGIVPGPACWEPVPP